MLRFGRPRMVRGAGLALAIALAACSSGGGSGSGGNGDFSVSDAVASLPAGILSGDEVRITVGDLARASELGGVERPTSVDDAMDWLVELTVGGDSDVYVPLGDVASTGAYYSAVEDYDAETGFSILDADSFVEAGTPPRVMAILTGDFSDDVFEDLEDLGDGVFSNGTLDDFEQDISNVGPIDRLGRSVRFAENDGRIAISTSTPFVEAWLDDDRDNASDDVNDVARALDDADVYGAMIVVLEDGFEFRPIPSSEAANSTDISEWMPTEEFGAVGVGLNLVDDEVVVTFVFAHDDADAAEANAEMFERTFTDGVSVVHKRPIDELYDLTEVTTDDNLVIVTAGLADGALISIPFNGLNSLDTPFFHA